MNTLITLSPFQTTDDAVVEKILFRLSVSSGWFAVSVVARSTDGTTAAWKFEQAVKHTVGGAIILVGNQGTLTAKDAGASTWDVDLTTDTDTITAQIQGQAGVTINWRITISLFKNDG